MKLFGKRLYPTESVKYVGVKIVISQKKAVRIINFQPRNFHTSPLFKQNFILKFQEKIWLENICQQIVK